MKEANVYQVLAGRVGFPQSKLIPQVFEVLVTPEEGEMLLALPASPSELAQKFQIDEVTAERKLNEFVRKGVCIPLEKDGVLRHACVRSFIQVHDATTHAIIGRKYEPVRDEVLHLWREFRETELCESMREVDASEGVLRVAPARGAIKDTSQLLPYEDVAAMIEEAPAIAVVDCPCRWLRVQEGECDKPTFVCLSFTPNAVKYIVDRGIGRQLSVDEAYEVLDVAAEAGLIPLPSGAPRVRSMCMCCTDCCLAFLPYFKYGYAGPGPSRFQAVVNTELCQGCGTCVQRCPFTAVELIDVPDAEKPQSSINPDKCHGCGVCVIKCPNEALELKLVRPVEHIPLTQT